MKHCGTWKTPSVSATATAISARFVELARSVYRHNDRRTALKRRINELLGSAIREEKQYTSYSA
jgi:hypothetical protein